MLSGWKPDVLATNTIFACFYSSAPWDRTKLFWLTARRNTPCLLERNVIMLLEPLEGVEPPSTDYKTVVLAIVLKGLVEPASGIEPLLTNFSKW